MSFQLASKLALGASDVTLRFLKISIEGDNKNPWHEIYHIYLVWL